MTPYVNLNKNGIFFTTAFLTFIYSFETFALYGTIVYIPEKYREIIVNILVLMAIYITGYLKIRPNKAGVIIADLMTIALAFIVSMKMMKYDDSFLNVLNIILASFVIIFMAFCASKEMLNDRYHEFIKYIDEDNKYVSPKKISREKFLRYSTKIAKDYVDKIDRKIEGVQNNRNHFIVPVKNNIHFKKLENNYYYLYRFYKSRGFDFSLIKTKRNRHIKIKWFLQD